MRVFYYAPENLIINLEEVSSIITSSCNPTIYFRMKNMPNDIRVDVPKNMIKIILQDIYDLMTEEK